MPAAPGAPWSAAQAGILGNAAAGAASAQINQLLASHPDTVIYQGTAILTPDGSGGALSAHPLSAYDLDQPFTLSGTSVARAQIPVYAVGTGADLIVSLCADNGTGQPGTMITQTRVPASWITQLSAVTAVQGTSPQVFQYTNSPLATATSNTMTMGAVAAFPWNAATQSGGTGAGRPAVACNGTNVIVSAGGINAAGTVITDVYTILYAGGNLLAAPVPQSPLPVGNMEYAGICVAADPASGDQYVVIAGGAYGTYPYTTAAAVYSATLTPATGALSSWATQPALPQAVQTTTAVAGGDTVYVIGGVNTSDTVLNTLYWAQMSNGQISSWNTTVLPYAGYNMYAAVSNGFLFIAGGSVTSGGATTTLAFYTRINADGSPGAWQAAPPLPIGNSTSGFGTSMPAGGDAIILRGTNNPGLFALPVSPNGPGPAWQQESYGSYANDALLPYGPGQWYWFEGFSGTAYTSTGYLHCPYISVPLPATGLTGGGTYHVLMQSPNGTANNYLGTVVDAGIVFPGNPKQLFSARGTYTWTASASSSTPITLYSNAGPSWPPWHTWEDSGGRVTTAIWATTPDQRLLGLCEATRSSAARNANTGFEAGTAPWSATNCTLAPSGAQAYTGTSSAKITPNGTSASVYITSELLPCLPGQQVTVSAWVWFTASVTLNASLSVNWYSSSGAGGGYISTSSNPVSVPAATWTQLSGTLTAPAFAYQYNLNPLLAGTPPASNVWYVDSVIATDLMTAQQSTVTQIEWGGTWPDSAWPGPNGAWPPLGVVELA